MVCTQLGNSHKHLETFNQDSHIEEDPNTDLFKILLIISINKSKLRFFKSRASELKGSTSLPHLAANTEPKHRFTSCFLGIRPTKLHVPEGQPPAERLFTLHITDPQQHPTTHLGPLGSATGDWFAQIYFQSENHRVKAACCRHSPAARCLTWAASTETAAANNKSHPDPSAHSPAPRAAQVSRYRAIP